MSSRIASRRWDAGGRIAVALLAALGLALACLARADAPPPPTMRAMALDRPGDATVLLPHRLPVPNPADDEVLIALDTVGVASWDVEIRRAPQSIHNSRLPLVLGTDGAGVVARLGRKVHGLRPGERVYAYSWDNPQGGFYAEYVAVPASRVARVPDRLTLVQAGAMGTTALTALQGVDDALHVRAGESIIIHGAAGGVGSMALQFAHARGARILATVTAPEDVEFVKRLGADAVVDGRHGDVAAAAHEFAPRGADALLALAGGDALAACAGSLKPDGRVAYPSGVRVPKLREGLQVTRYDAVPGPKEFQRLNAAIELARLEVPITAEFPLEEAARAHERIESGHVQGKVVLRIAPQRVAPLPSAPR